MGDCKTAKDKSFEENFRKLEKLSQELQENCITVDELVPRMKEALIAIKVCKDDLKETKTKLTEVTTEFKEIEESQS